ncbi:MAG: hypothetical protein AABY89_01590 [Acidobacteriota bacterium]
MDGAVPHHTGTTIPADDIRLVAFLYAALTLVLAYPLTANPAGSVLSASPDTSLLMWILSWDTHAFTHQPLSMFDANIYHPLRHTLAFAENLIGSALIAAPILWLTDNAVLAMNVVSLLSCALCGLGAYVLARRVGMGHLGATLGGLVFAFSPPRFFRLGQLHLTAVWWLPFGLASLHAYLDGGRRRDLWLFAAFVTLQALSSGHGTVFLALAAMCLVAYRVVLGEPVVFVRRLRDLGVPGALLLLPAALMLLPYRSVQAEVGLKRSLVDWAIDPTSFLASPSHLQGFLLSLLPNAHINENAQAYLFPGYLPLALAAAAVLWRRKKPARHGPLQAPASWARAALVLNLAALSALAISVWLAVTGPIKMRMGTTVLFSARSAWRAWLVFVLFVALRVAFLGRAPFAVRPRLRQWLSACHQWWSARRQNAVTFYGLLTLVSLWLSVGPPIGLWPLVYWLPVLNFIRVPSRFTVLAMLGLAVLAGFGFDRLSARVAPGKRRVLALVLGALLVAEFAAAPLATVPYRVEIPAADRRLDGQPKPFAVAEVPLPDPMNAGATERRHTDYMLHSMAHWQKTVHGYSGIRPALHENLYLQLRNFPDDRSLRDLTDLGVGYVVVHTDLYPPGEWEAVQQRIRLFEAWLQLEHVAGEGRVYSLRRPPASGMKR